MLDNLSFEDLLIILVIITTVLILASKFGKQDDGKTTTFKEWYKMGKFRKYGKDDDENIYLGYYVLSKIFKVYDGLI